MTGNEFSDEQGDLTVEIAPEADPVLLGALEQARAALAEITPAETIGEFIGHEVEGEHVLSLFFASKLAGYPDWHWTATLARSSDSAEPSVLEVELLPGEASVLSPAWVPWADRLTSDPLIDDSESEFDEDEDDDDDVDGPEDGAAGDYADDESDDDDDGESDDDESEDDDVDGPDDDLDDDPSAIGRDRDRDGIDIDIIAEEGLDAPGFGSSTADDHASDERTGDYRTVDAHAAAAPVPDPRPLILSDDTGIDPDAGVAFDATDDFTDAGDIEHLEGQERPE
ncbi:DUF3027 domain-containing protein [Subtercola boreus]|uniref:DUF3027 domain-containing protein n=1 Tax=Subtercola boreus TaxID=120213 RepID=UPI0015584264|nr:DUF3027 domain-containing protein [Subtercola boreus]